jgi:hypothetical protein
MTEAKIVRIRVKKGGKEVIDLNLPVKLLGTLEDMIPQKELEKLGMDVKGIIKILKTDVKGKVIDLKSDNTEVEVIVE